ncbi:MAG: FecR family protein, partial [Limisphaerales bacterium]
CRNTRCGLAKNHQPALKKNHKKVQNYLLTIGCEDVIMSKMQHAEGFNMKNIRNIVSAALCGLALTVAASASAQGIKQGVATVVRVQGEASYSLSSDPNAQWHPLVAGKILRAGTVIKTEPNALVDVVLGKDVAMPQALLAPGQIWKAPDSKVRGLLSYTPAEEQNVIRLSGGTVLAIDKLTVSDTGVDAVSDTELDLRQGRIFASVKKLSATSQYLIKIPNGIAGVRGTLFTLSADGSCGVLRDSVTESITLPDGRLVTVRIDQGDQVNPQNGQIYQLSPELINLLQQISIALDTVYFDVVAYAHDKTMVFVSPTIGPSSTTGD